MGASDSEVSLPQMTITVLFLPVNIVLNYVCVFMYRYMHVSAEAWIPRSLGVTGGCKLPDSGFWELNLGPVTTQLLPA